MAEIVVIEDNPANLELMTYLLQAFGHTPRGCTDGESGIDTIRARPPHLVLCDIQLPGQSGYDVLRLLRAEPELCDIPAVAVTALAMRGDREKVLSAGFNGYLEKPLQPETFVGLVETFLPATLRSATRPPEAPPQSTARAAARTVLSASADGAPSPATILIVDDIDSNLELMRTILQHGGYRVLSARSMAAALAQLRTQPADLVITDVHMPGGDGFALCHAVAEDAKLPRIPFVFVSATVVNGIDFERAARLSPCRLLLRPIDPGEMLAIVRACLSRA